MKMNIKKLVLSSALIFLSGQLIQCKENKQSVAEKLWNEKGTEEIDWRG